MMIQTNSLRGEMAMVNPSIEQLQQDVKIALEHVMGDSSPEMLSEMSEIFMEDAIPLLDQMAEGHISQDFTAVSIAAHTLKGSSATIGLQKFAALCLEVETSCKAKDPNQIGHYIGLLKAEYALIEEALSQFLL